MKHILTIFLMLVIGVRAMAIIPNIPIIPEQGKHISQAKDSSLHDYVKEINRIKRRANSLVKVKINHFELFSSNHFNLRNEIFAQNLLQNNSLLTHQTIYLDVLIKPPIA